VVPNGFDESAFLSAEQTLENECAIGSDDIVLLHSGTIYPTPDRDTSIFFRALKRVLDNRADGARKVKVILRASAVGDHYVALIGQLNLQGNVVFAPALPYESALREMLSADGLLIFQGYTSNPAIPAKLYEYFRAGRPILALADSDGETARLIREEAAGEIAALDDEDSIVAGLGKFLHGVELGESRIMATKRVAAFERANAAGRFADLFDMVAV
jgi:glycosyltransferase involved in cell wall biosynthesis